MGVLLILLFTIITRRRHHRLRLLGRPCADGATAGMKAAAGSHRSHVLPEGGASANAGDVADDCQYYDAAVTVAGGQQEMPRLSLPVVPGTAQMPLS